MLRSPPTYSTGTVTGQIGTNQLIGVGTNWVSQDATGVDQYNVAAFDDLFISGQRFIGILSVDDDQHITLTEALPFGIAPGTAYTIIRRTVSPALATGWSIPETIRSRHVKSPSSISVFR